MAEVKGKKLFLRIAMLPLSVFYAVFPFIRAFCDIAVLPYYNTDAGGNSVYAGTTTFYYPKSIYDRFSGLNIEFLLYLEIALAALCVIFTVISLMKKDCKKAKILAGTFFLIATILFLVLLLVGGQQWAAY